MDIYINLGKIQVEIIQNELIIEKIFMENYIDLRIVTDEI
jgi:hypothetical protein